MKLYFYLKHFPPDCTPTGEGTSKAVQGLASGLTACGVEVDIICESTWTDISYKTKEGFSVTSFASENTKPALKVSSSLKQYIASISTSEQNLFVLNGIFHRSVYVLSRLLSKYSLPYIVAPHDMYHPSIFRKNAYLKWPYWYFLERTVLKQARAVQVLDKRQTEWLRRLGIKTPTIEVPNGFSPNDVSEKSTLSWNTESKPKFLFFGRLDAYHKGLDILLNACAQLTELPDWRLTIQGPEWGDRIKLEEQAIRLKLSDKVIFLEPDYNLSPVSIIKNHDIFCLTSRFEGFGLTALEAMLAGRVLLVSEIAGIAPHVIASGCGVVVNSEPNAIKTGLLELLHQRSKWQEMGLKGQQYVLNNLNWNSIAAKALDDYKYFLS